MANNDIHITDKKDIEMKGSQIIGDNVSMNAGENITLSAAENRSSSDTKESSKSSQAGMILHLQEIASMPMQAKERAMKQKGL